VVLLATAEVCIDQYCDQTTAALPSPSHGSLPIRYHRVHAFQRDVLHRAAQKVAAQLDVYKDPRLPTANNYTVYAIHYCTTASITNNARSSLINVKRAGEVDVSLKC